MTPPGLDAALDERHFLMRCDCNARIKAVKPDASRANEIYMQHLGYRDSHEFRVVYKRAGHDGGDEDRREVAP